jgi:transposase
MTVITLTLAVAAFMGVYAMFDSLNKVAHHEVRGAIGATDVAYGVPAEAPQTDFLWCPNCFLAMKVAKGSRGVFSCPKCSHEFFA